MKLIAKRSSDPVIGLSLGIFLLIISVVCMLFTNSKLNATFIVPEIIGAIMILLFTMQLTKSSSKLIYYDEENKSLVINQGSEKKTIKLSELTNLYKEASGIRRNYTGSLIFAFGDGCICVSNVANADNVALEIERLKKQADQDADEKLKYFEKL